MDAAMSKGPNSKEKWAFSKWESTGCYMLNESKGGGVPRKGDFFWDEEKQN